MDRVRFGRALGYGARHAAKAVAKAVEAAAAPNPSAAANPAATAQRTAPTGPAQAASTGARAAQPPGPRSTQSVGERMAQAQATVRQGKAHAGHLPGHLRRHIGTPLARFSSVVWLQVTGTFFALLAAFLSQGLWKDRGAARLPVHTPGVGTFYLHAAAFAIFVYFAVSSFVRAHLRQRR